MENSFVYLIAALASVAFASFVSYDGERARSARFALGVILLASVATPLFSAIRDFSPEDLDFTAGEYESDTAKEVTEGAFCLGISRAVADRFSLDEEDIEVVCRGFKLETVSAETVTVRLSGRAALADSRAIREYIRSSGFGECEVEIYFE